MNDNKICVFDFETDGKIPEVCSPVQLAAVMVDPHRLEIIKGSEFNINFKPEPIELDENYEYTTDIVDWHAKIKNTSKSAILEDWKKFPLQKVSWKLFTDYLEKYHTRNVRKNEFSAPIPCGYNINKFDLVIIDRLARKYNNLSTKENKPNLFYPRDSIDIMNIIYLWFESDQELKSFTLDNLRDYFGISKVGAHDAFKDVMDTAEIMMRFLRLHRTLKKKIKFKGSFRNEKVSV